MELHERIALARKQAGLSQEQLGEKLGVSRQAVSKWESGQSNPDVAYIAGMCRLFGVSSDWLLLGEEAAQASSPARCSRCQTIVTGLDNYCPNCGWNLRATGKYALLMHRDNYLAQMDALTALSASTLLPTDSPLGHPLSPEEILELREKAPCILARGLTLDQCKELRQIIVKKAPNAASSFAFYPDSTDDAFDLLKTQEPLSDEQLEEAILENIRSKAPLPNEQLDPPKEPLSFGMIVLAVVVGIIVASFL